MDGAVGTDVGRDLDEAIPRVRKCIALYGEPLSYLSGFAELPDGGPRHRSSRRQRGATSHRSRTPRG